MPFSDYRITSPYGFRADPINGQRSFHDGIDLVKSHRAPIDAFVDGKVLYAGNGVSGTGVGGYGNVVVIQDKNSRAHVYAHLDSVFVKKGQTVQRGDVIGRQGATGTRVTGSHLHYEVRKKSSPSLGWVDDPQARTLDPTKYVNDYYAARETLYLPKSESSWRVYPTNVAPVKGNEIGFLNPKKFGGLQYEVLAKPQANVVTIQTSDFGKVNIYVHPSTGAVIR